MIGVAVWILVIPTAALVMRRRPEDSGLLPDGDTERAASEDARSEGEASGDFVWTRGEVIRQPALWMLILTFGLAGTGLGAMLLHLVPYLTDSGFSAAAAAGGFGMIGLSGLVSKPLWGLAIERYPTRYCAASEFAILALGILLIMQVNSVLTMYLAITVLGIGIGGVVTVQEVIWANYFGRLSLGLVRGIGRPFTIVSSAAGPVLAGAAYDIGGSYTIAFAVFVLTYVAAAVLVLLTPRPLEHRQERIE